MKNADDQLILEGFVELDDVYWSGKKNGGKRGPGPPGKTPFLAGVWVKHHDQQRKEGYSWDISFYKLKAFITLPG